MGQPGTSPIDLQSRHDPCPDSVRTLKSFLLPCVSVLCVGLGNPGRAAESVAKPAILEAPAHAASNQAAPSQIAPGQVAPSQVAPAQVAPTSISGKGGSEAQRYCQNIAAAAADARFAFQAKQLTELEAHLRDTMAALEAKQAEFRELLAKREAVMKQAAASLVGIYAKMKPDAAASQLAALDDGTAAAVLMQLNARQASAILNEVKPDRAVQLVNTMTGVAAQTADGKKS